MFKKTSLIFWICLAGIVILPLGVQAGGFNIMSGDPETLKLKNETQGTSQWTDPLSANAGDYIRFNVYYHCGATGSNIPQEKAQNTVVRLTFPSTAQNTVIANAQISSSTAASTSDSGTINVSSSQRLVFDATAKWYKDNNQSVSDLAVVQGADYVEVNLGELNCDSQNCFTNAGYVIFRARLSTTAVPTVDLKANGYDGTITIPYNTAATLSWTSTNATSCTASGDWSGSKYTSGSESTGNLTSSRNYTITCAGSGGSASDSVSVSVSSLPQTLYVGLEAIPNSGTAPLNGVDLRATVTGTASGTINYKFDCTSDGVWDHAFYGIYDNPKTVFDACNYQYQGSYVAKVKVERGTANPAEATAVIIVGSGAVQDVNIIKLARNLSDNTAFGEVVASDPGEVIEFRILITSTSSNQISNLIVKDTLPDKMSFYTGLKIDEVNVSGNVLTGLDIGTLNPLQTKTVAFQAVVANASNFSYGITELINTALVYNTSIARTDTAKVQVTRTEVKGATDVPTGMLDSAKISFIVAGLATLLLTYFLLLKFYLGNRAYVWGVNDALGTAKEKIAKFLPKEPDRKKEERLARIIEEIRKREKLD